MVISKSRVQAISYAKAVPPTTANKKRKKLDEPCAGSVADELFVVRDTATSTIPGSLFGIPSLAILSAATAASRFKTTADAMVRRKPYAGSRTNPASNVPPTAPSVLTQ